MGVRFAHPQPVIVFKQPFHERVEPATTEPRLVYAQGDIVLVWSVGQVIYCATSQDGIRWDDPQRICLEREPLMKPLYIQSCQRTVHLVWQSGDRAIRYTRSRDGGRRWDQPRTLHWRNRTDPERDELNGFALWQNNLYISWNVSVISNQENPRDPRPPYGMFSRNGGNDWKSLNSPIPHEIVALDERILVGQIRGEEWLSEDKALTWNLVKERDRPVPPEDHRHIWFGGEHVTYYMGLTSQHELNFRASVDAGKRWLQTQTLAKLPELEGSAQTFLTFAEHDRIWAALVSSEEGKQFLFTSGRRGESISRYDLSKLLAGSSGWPTLTTNGRAAVLAWWHPSQQQLSLQATAILIK